MDVRDNTTEVPMMKTNLEDTTLVSVVATLPITQTAADLLGRQGLLCWPHFVRRVHFLYFMMLKFSIVLHGMQYQLGCVASILMNYYSIIMVASIQSYLS